MKNTIIIALLILLVFTNGIPANDRNKIHDFKKGEIKLLMFKVTDWQNNHTEHLAKYRPLNWHLATYYIGIMEMYKVTGEQKYFDQMYELGKKYNWATENDVYDADRIAVGQMYLDVFKEKGDPEIIRRLKWVFDAHIERMPPADLRFSGNEYRREWWTWCDALFMAPPTFAKMYEATGEEKYLEYAIKHWMLTTDYLFDKEDNLIYRDDRFFDQRTSSNKKVYWSRGNGWVFGGLVHMLKIIPTDHPKRSVFVNQFKGMAAALAKIQNKDGMWRPSLMDEKAFPLCIVFFAAKGKNGEDIFDTSLKSRDGVFRGYTKSDINNYHISYYANTKDNRAREVAHLRKNAGFNKVVVGEPGIPVESTETYKVKLVKADNHILMYIDERKIIDWKNDREEYGDVLNEGKIGLRQMQWTHFRYRNFKVWALNNSL